jgi:hypothetical protein
MSELTAEDRERLAIAKEQLTEQSIATRIAGLIGTPIEKGLAMLPEGAKKVVDRATTEAITRALDVAIMSLVKGRGSSLDKLHLGLAALSGGVGGAFGLPALLIELPISTTLMLRSIADIAQAHGEILEDVEARLACVQVFALGGPGADDDAADTSYFATRTALGRLTAEAARHLAGGAASREAPALVRLISAIAARFGLVVSEKAAAVALPAVGAIGGALINTLFMDHFQELARGHFTVRALERHYGPAAVRQAYERID